MASGQSGHEATEIAGKVIAHLRENWRTIARYGAYWFFALWIARAVTGTLKPSGAPPTGSMAAIAAVLILITAVMSLWLSVPYIVRCHRLVLFGAESAKAGSVWRWGPTEWRFFRMGFVLAIMALGIVAAFEIVAALAAAGLSARTVLLPLGIAMGIVTGLFVSGLAMLLAQIVVIDGSRPIHTSINLMWHRRGLWFLLYFGFLLAVLFANVAIVLLGLLLVAVLGKVAVVLSGALTAALAVVTAAAGATGLSITYLHVRSDLPPDAEAPAPATV